MRISGFSFARNVDKLYYPIEASIRSILPICDEFIIAIGKGDPDDHTRERVASIGDPRIRIIDTEWTDRERLKGLVHSQQTNIALDACSGDWCFYVQADEVVHEDDLPIIKARCTELLNDTAVEGLLFNYLHFWGDYDHYHVNHTAYPREIRIVRNRIGVQSFSSAQSFRRSGEKLRVASVNARIFHYGWVRPPRLMSTKSREMAITHHGREKAAAIDPNTGFDYGPLDRLTLYRNTHPAVMKDWIAKMDWKDELQYTGKPRTRHKHHQMKYRILTFLEQKLFGGKVHLGAKGHVLLRR